ncbi:MAG: hypothetical protein NUV64_03240 [Parcubacteria group bacterium]|nr:hypothetical protein [Parcubacteria group bacterium]
MLYLNNKTNKRKSKLLHPYFDDSAENRLLHSQVIFHSLAFRLVHKENPFDSPPEAEQLASLGSNSLRSL